MTTVGLDARTDGECTYIKLTDQPIKRTVSVGESVMVDLDAAGHAVGIELLYGYPEP